MIVLIGSQWELKRDAWLGSHNYDKGSVGKVSQIVLSEKESYITMRMLSGQEISVQHKGLIKNFKEIKNVEN